MKLSEKWKRGLPYTGNKGQKAQQIIDNLPNAQRFVDVFGGGGSVSLHAVSSGKYKSVIYNDRLENVVKLLKTLLQDDPHINLTKYAYISRNEFMNWRDNQPDSVERTLVLICYSFGNDMHSYLWGKNNELKKIKLTQALFDGNTGTALDELFDKSKEMSLISEKYSFYHKWRKEKMNIKTDSSEQLQQLERLQRLEQLQQLERLQRLEQLQRLQQLEYSIDDYHDLNINSGDVVYCDPPYINTAKSYGKFDNDDFDVWMNQLPTNDIYISEYTVLPHTVIIADLGKKQNFISTAKSKRKSELLLKYIKH